MTEAEEKDERPPLKSYKQILEAEILAGLAELKRPASGLFLSSLSAGLDIGFSVLLMAASLTLLRDYLNPALNHIVLANMYSLGFILVILGRSELFTEHTALAVLPVLNRSAGIDELGRVWGIVFTGNIIGGILFALLVAWFAPAMGISTDSALIELTAKMVDHKWWVILISAILAGWLMGELAWLLAAARETVSQILCVWIVTTAIGLLGLHHVVVGTVEILAGVIVSSDYHLTDLLRFIWWAAIGNALGGVFFVACVKYGHVARGRDKIEKVSDKEQK